MPVQMTMTLNDRNAPSHPTLVFLRLAVYIVKVKEDRSKLSAANRQPRVSVDFSDVFRSCIGSHVIVQKFVNFRVSIRSVNYKGHSIERIYLRQRSSDGSVNKTILKPRLALAARRQYVYVGLSRLKIPRSSAARWHPREGCKVP